MQLQGRMCGLSQVVGELEERDAELGELESWAAERWLAVTEWKSRPVKLRVEAARAEAAPMIELLNAIPEKISRLLTHLPPGPRNQSVADNIDSLQHLLMDTLAKKQGDEALIERYRNACADGQQWLDTIAKRLEQVEKGRGLGLAQKLNTLEAISHDLDQKREPIFESVRNLAEQVFNVVSNLDAQQVEDQMKGVERRYNDMTKRVERKTEVIRTTQKELASIGNEIGLARIWIKEKLDYLQNPPPLGFESKASEERIHLLKGTLKEAEGKQVLVGSAERRLNGISNELEPSEIQSTEQDIRALESETTDLIGALKAGVEKVMEADLERKQLESKLDLVRDKLGSLVAMQAQIITTDEPLFVASIEKRIIILKDYEDDVKDFGDGDLASLQKQGAALYKDCTDSDRSKLEAILSGLSNEHGALAKKVQDHENWLQSLLDKRQELEASIDRCQQWLNQAEVALSADMRTSNLSLIQEQLNKYTKLNSECDGVGDEIRGIQETTSMMKLGEPDRLMLLDTVRGLSARHAQVKSAIANRIKALGDALDNFKQVQEKVNKTVELVGSVQAQVKELSKPVGNRAEDVQATIDSYQKLLDQLKNWKSGLGELGDSGEGIAPLQSALQQQDDLIRMLEDQIARLQQLLRLRQQFIALVTDITTFIATYTDVVRDIEQSGQSSQDKIRRYDEVIGKIQECEAMLAAAVDKGEQIAAEGSSAADRNCITEQLQSLKQQVQALKRAVENQRSRHLELVQEHTRLTAELGDLLDWLHANEASVKLRPLLDITVHSVDLAHEQHKELAGEVNSYLERLSALKDRVKHCEDQGLPDILFERLSEATSLLNTLPAQLQEREDYIIDNRNSRLKYEELRVKLFEWVEEANRRLAIGKDGVVLDTIVADLDNHKRFFGEERKLLELVSVEVQAVSDEIWPSLSATDQDSLSGAQQQMGQLLKNTLNTAKSRQAELEQAAELVKLYREAVAGVTSLVATTSKCITADTADTVSTLAGLHFNIEKIEHAIASTQHHQPEVDLLNERGREMQALVDAKSKEKITAEVVALNDQWEELIVDLHKRKREMLKMVSLWEEFEGRLQEFESAVSTVQERNKHVDTVVRNKPQQIESKEIVQELLKTVKRLKSDHDSVMSSSVPIVQYLEQNSSPESVQNLREKLTTITAHYTELTSTLEERFDKIKKDLEFLEKVEKEVESLQKELDDLKTEVVELYVFGADQENTEKQVEALKVRVEDYSRKVKALSSETREAYLLSQQHTPTDINQQLTNLELLSENVISAMDEKVREQKRARTVRTEYAAGVEVLTAWLQHAELKVQDKTSQPQVIKESLQQIQSELPAMQERLEQVTQNAKVLCEKSRDDEEKMLIRSKVDSLTEQMAMIRAWIDDKKQQIGDCLDSWDRFLTLYNTVMNWVKDKQDFVSQPLHLDSLTDAKQKLHEYTGAVKSCKSIGKTVSEMSKELERIGESGSIGDLPDMMEEAETAKAEVEGQLLERHALVHETSEEWEQCERKLREVRGWLDKCKATIDAGTATSKKKSLRDQLANREKMMSDIAIQKSKIEVSVEKLQVHFRSGVSGGGNVAETGSALKVELDGLLGIVKQQSVELEATIAQVEQYQQEILQLKQDVVSSEQKLRMVSCPTYLPNDRDTALTEQNGIVQSDLSKNAEESRPVDSCTIQDEALLGEGLPSSSEAYDEVEEPIRIEDDTKEVIHAEKIAGIVSESENIVEQTEIKSAEEVAQKPEEYLLVSDDTVDGQPITQMSTETVSSVDEDVIVHVTGELESQLEEDIKVSAHVDILEGEENSSETTSCFELSETNVVSEGSRRRTVVRKRVVVDGVEKITEEIVDEPPEESPVFTPTPGECTTVTEEVDSRGNVRRIITQKKRIIKKIVIVDGKKIVNEVVEDPQEVEISEVIDDDQEEDPESVTRFLTGQDDPIQKEKTKRLKKEPKVEESSEPTSLQEHFDPNLAFIEGEQRYTSGPDPDTVVVTRVTESGDVERLLSPRGSRELYQMTGYDPLTAPEGFNVTAVQSSTCRSIRKVRKVIRKVVNVDGREIVTEEVVEEPDEVEVVQSQPSVSIMFSSDRKVVLPQSGGEIPNVELVELTPEPIETFKRTMQTSVHTVLSTTRRVVRKVTLIDGKEIVTEEFIDSPETFDLVTGTDDSSSVSIAQKVDLSSCLPKPEKISDAPEITLNIVPASTVEELQAVHYEPLTSAEPTELEQVVKEQTEFGNETSSETKQVITTSTTVQRQIKTRKRIIRKIVLVDGKEQVSEETIEEPVEVEITEIEPATITIDEKCVEKVDRETLTEPERTVPYLNKSLQFPSVNEQSETSLVSETESPKEETETSGLISVIEGEIPSDEKPEVGELGREVGRKELIEEPTTEVEHDRVIQDDRDETHIEPAGDRRPEDIDTGGTVDESPYEVPQSKSLLKDIQPEVIEPDRVEIKITDHVVVDREQHQSTETVLEEQPRSEESIERREKVKIQETVGGESTAPALILVDKPTLDKNVQFPSVSEQSEGTGSLPETPTTDKTLDRGERVEESMMPPEEVEPEVNQLVEEKIDKDEVLVIELSAEVSAPSTAEEVTVTTPTTVTEDIGKTIPGTELPEASIQEKPETPQESEKEHAQEVVETPKIVFKSKKSKKKKTIEPLSSPLKMSKSKVVIPPVSEKDSEQEKRTTRERQISFEDDPLKDEIRKEESKDDTDSVIVVTAKAEISDPGSPVLGLDSDRQRQSKGEPSLFKTKEKVAVKTEPSLESCTSFESRESTSSGVTSSEQESTVTVRALLSSDNTTAKTTVKYTNPVEPGNSDGGSSTLRVRVELTPKDEVKVAVRASGDVAAAETAEINSVKKSSAGQDKSSKKKKSKKGKIEKSALARKPDDKGQPTGKDEDGAIKLVTAQLIAAERTTGIKSPEVVVQQMSTRRQLEPVEEIEIPQPAESVDRPLPPVTSSSEDVTIHRLVKSVRPEYVQTAFTTELEDYQSTEEILSRPDVITERTVVESDSKHSEPDIATSPDVPEQVESALIGRPETVDPIAESVRDIVSEPYAEMVKPTCPSESSKIEEKPVKIKEKDKSNDAGKKKKKKSKKDFGLTSPEKMGKKTREITSAMISHESNVPDAPVVSRECPPDDGGDDFFREAEEHGFEIVSEPVSEETVSSLELEEIKEHFSEKQVESKVRDEDVTPQNKSEALTEPKTEIGAHSAEMDIRPYESIPVTEPVLETSSEIKPIREEDSPRLLTAVEHDKIQGTAKPSRTKKKSKKTKHEMEPAQEVSVVAVVKTENIESATRVEYTTSEQGTDRVTVRVEQGYDDPTVRVSVTAREAHELECVESSPIPCALESVELPKEELAIFSSVTGEVTETPKEVIQERIMISAGTEKITCPEGMAQFIKSEKDETDPVIVRSPEPTKRSDRKSKKKVRQRSDTKYATLTPAEKPTPSEEFLSAESSGTEVIPVEPSRVTADDVIADIRTRTLPSSSDSGHCVAASSYKAVIAELDLNKNQEALSGNLEKLKSRDIGDEEKQSVVMTTVTIISEYLETITYIVINIKNSSEGVTPDEKISRISNLKEELTGLQDGICALVSSGEAVCDSGIVEALQSQAEMVSDLVTRSRTDIDQERSFREECLNLLNNISVLIQQLGEDIEVLEKNHNITVEEKLAELERMEKTNGEYRKEMVDLMKADVMKGWPPSEAETAVEAADSNDHAIVGQRDALLQRLALAQEYRDTLGELEQVTTLAEIIVESPIVVSHLQHLQEEMQKHRKFFVNLTHCQSLLESLEAHLDEETRERHAEMHSDLYTRASDILEKAAQRAEAMALAASRWTILEQGLTEEKRWLMVAQRRLPHLTGVTSADYHQYISLYQALCADISLHCGRICQFLEAADSLHSMLKCDSLSEECADIQQTILELQSGANTDLLRLLKFRDVWQHCETLTDKLEAWLTHAEKNKCFQEEPLNMRKYWEMKAEYEVYKRVNTDSINGFELAMRTLAIADENLQRQYRSQTAERWNRLEANMSALNTTVQSMVSSSTGSVADKLDLIEKQIKNMKALLNDMHSTIKTQEELQYYIERLQVLKEGVNQVEEDLVKLGVLPIEEADRASALESENRRLEMSVCDELDRALVLRDKLSTLMNGLARVDRDQGRASNVLDQCQSCLDGLCEDVQQALQNCMGVCDTLREEWSRLMSLRQVLHGLPGRGLRVSLSAVQIEREMSRLQTTHGELEARAEALLRMLGEVSDLWTDYRGRLDSVKTSAREADFMMQLLKLHGSVDYQRLVKTTERLKGVCESLDAREGSLEELKGCAAELKERCSASVVERLEAEVEEAIQEWEQVSRSVATLCSQYGNAARLWANYTEATDQIKQWLQDAPTHPPPAHLQEEIEAKRRALVELERLAGEIAAQLEAPTVLEAELKDLGETLHRAQDLLPEAKQQEQYQQELHQKTQAAAQQIASIQQSLSNDKNNELTERLVGLRDQLIELGKTEAQVRALRSQPDLQPTAKNELNIVNTLKLWQQVFRETFQEYHRLSAQLVTSEDGPAVMSLWHDYLLHVNHFLESSIPDQYHLLNEHNHLCQVHQNVLSCQEALLNKRGGELVTEGRGGHLQSQVDLSFVEQFNSLTNLHNETLAKIMDRQTQVQSRISAWEKYREDQGKLLSWLKDIEEERNRLKLRYLHIKTTTKTLLSIQDMLDKISEGEAQEKELLNQLTKLIALCEDSALANTLRMEHAAIAHRISNLQAALQTWKSFLARVNDDIETYETRVNKIQKSLTDVHNELSPDSGTNTECCFLPYSQLQNRLAKMKAIGESIEALNPEFDDLNKAKERLKESLSPSDMKAVTQRVWLLEQHAADVQHQLTMASQSLQHRLQLSHMYDKRQARFLQWCEGLEEQLGRLTGGTLEAGEVLHRLETELAADVSLKRREMDWLTSTAADLIAAEQNPTPRPQDRSNHLQQTVASLNEAWRRILAATDMRATKLRSIIQGLSQLEVRMDELRDWLYNIDRKLSSPITLETANKEEMDAKMAAHEELQKKIEMKSSEIGDILNLCEILLNDCDSCDVRLNTEGITVAMSNLEKRWKGVCVNSAERKLTLVSIWTLVQQILGVTREQEEWLREQGDKTLTLVNRLESSLHDQLPLILQDAQRLECEVRSGGGQGASLLEELYSKLTRGGTVNVNVLCVDDARTLLKKWYDLRKRIEDLCGTASRHWSLVGSFRDAHSRALEALARVDAHLTVAEAPEAALLASLETNADIQRHLEKVEKEMEKYGDVLREADVLGLEVMSISLPEDVNRIQSMIDEYQQLWKSITTRLNRLKEIKQVPVVEPKQTQNQCVEVNTLKFETDRSTQVNTLPVTMAPLMRKDAYILELKKTCEELQLLLDKIEFNESATHQETNKILGRCQSTVELMRHLSDVLMDQCSASKEEAMTDQVQHLTARFNNLHKQAQLKEATLKQTSVGGRLTCPLCSRRNWKQLENDLWRLEQWLHHAQVTIASHPTTPPSGIDRLEDLIQDHRELLLDLDSHRSLVVSLNIVGTHLAEHSEDEERAIELRTRLQTANSEWESICSAAARYHNVLQTALMQNEEFHDTMAELLEWLERTEIVIRQSEPVDVTEPTHVIRAKYDKFKELRRELERCEPRVMTLEECAGHLLGEREHQDQQEAEEGVAASRLLVRQRLTGIRLRLQALARLTSVYVLRLAAVLGHDPPQLQAASLYSLSNQLLDTTATSAGHRAKTSDTDRGDELDGEEEGAEAVVDTSVLKRCNRLLGRVIRASVPISALLLLLLGAAALLPLSQNEQQQCSTSTGPSGIIHAITPLLRYPDGRPPI